MFSCSLTQIARMTSRVIRSNGTKNVMKRYSHDHAGTAPPPFVQRRAPNKSLSEHAELIWEDGVAPETSIDFDVKNLGTGRALAWLLSGMGFFLLLWEGVKHYDPSHLARFTPRENPKLKD